LRYLFIVFFIYFWNQNDTIKTNFVSGQFLMHGSVKKVKNMAKFVFFYSLGTIQILCDTLGGGGWVRNCVTKCHMGRGRRGSRDIFGKCKCRVKRGEGIEYCHQMTQGAGAGGGGLKSAKNYHFLFEWPFRNRQIM